MLFKAIVLAVLVSLTAGVDLSRRFSSFKFMSFGRQSDVVVPLGEISEGGTTEETQQSEAAKKAKKAKPFAIQLDMTYFEMTLLLARILGPVAMQKGSTLSRLYGGEIEIQSIGMDQLFEDVELNLKKVENPRMIAKLRTQLAPFKQFVEQAVQEKASAYRQKSGQQELSPREKARIVGFQFRAFLVFARQLSIACAVEFRQNTPKMMQFWRSFRESYPYATAPVQSMVDEDVPFLHMPPNQFCARSRHHFKQRLNWMKKNKQIGEYFVHQLPSRFAKFALQLPTVMPQNNEKVQTELGEEAEATPIQMSVYKLKKFESLHGMLHATVNFGGLEVHYTTDGIWVTKFGEFGSRKIMTYLKRVDLLNVRTRFSVRQVEAVLDQMAEQQFNWHDDIDQNCVHFIRALLERIATDPLPEEFEMMEYASTSDPMLREVVLAETGEKVTQRRKEVQFLRNPKVLEHSKSWPRPMKSALRRLTKITHQT